VNARPVNLQRLPGSELDIELLYFREHSAESTAQKGEKQSGAKKINLANKSTL
jgi:hypothetical protein